MASTLEPLKALVSFDTVGVTVLQEGRTIYAHTSAQQAMSSVLGLIMASARCPWADQLRPMALLDSYTTLLAAARERSFDDLKPLFHTWRNRENLPI